MENSEVPYCKDLEVVARKVGDLDDVYLLNETAAEVNAVDNQGRAPTGLPIVNGHDKVAELLREHFGVE